MTIIAGKPFTQLTNLNITDELRVQGISITGTVSETIVEVSTTYTVDVDDDFVVGTGTFNITLPSLSAAVREVTIKARASTTLTILPDGSDTIEAGATPVTSNTAVSLLPTSVAWVIV